MKRFSFRRPFIALALLVAFFSQATWVLAGTTGGVAGQVTDEAGAPVPGAAVKAVSASQSATATTDASGRFNFLSLAPDTYTVSIEKDGYNPVSYAGVTVFADNNLTLSFKMAKALKTIAKVSATSAGNLVKGGVGSDIYSVNSQAIAASSALGGGSNLNSAYSAIASVPGVTVPSGGMGWNQPTYVRGSQSFFTGFEYDGIPVNRAFDNYNSSTESNLGLQELQVYTGGGPSSSASAGTSGFVNQVFKTGTYPGYLDLSAGIGTPTFYHQAKVEAGGATPDRRFSYYVGISGYNQDFRYLNNSNGASWFADPNGPYTGESTVNAPFEQNAIIPATAECDATGADTNPLASAAGSWYGIDNQNLGGAGANCFNPYNGIYGQATPAQIIDRENIANLHFRIPRKNGTSDDIQLLGSTSMFFTQYYSSPNDAGGLNAYTLATTGAPYNAASNFPSYVDALVYNAPFGTPISGLKTQWFYQPSSPQNRQPDSAIGADFREGIFNDTGIVKLQYTHQFSSNAFARVFGYTFFSDWTQAGPLNAFGQCQTTAFGPCDPVTPNYDLITHTGGGQLELVDQINSQHLLQLTGNYTSANVVRFNDNGFLAGASPIGIISKNSQGVYSCWDERNGSSTFDQSVPCVPSGKGAKPWTSNSVKGAYASPPTGFGPNATAAGAQWVTLWNGGAKGSYNTVKPQFSFVSLSDQWRPTDKLLFNAQLRYEDYKYGLNSNVDPGTAFYAQIIPNDVCQNSSGTVYSQPLGPGQPPPAPVIYTATCPAGYSHANFTAQSPNTYDVRDLSPRLSATYTQSPDTVWRGSIGRFTEPPISASVQYLNVSGNNLSVWTGTLPLGFTSPFHPIPPMSATQADLSLERHIHGTDMSFKISPFYNYTVGYQAQSFIGAGFVTQAPVGNFRSMGAEFAFTKGDFSKDGLSGQVALTYTDAKVQYTNYFGSNQMSTANSVISQYNLLTKGGGGSPFYCSGGADASGNANPGVSSAAACAGLATPGVAITNPYYNNAPQPLFDTQGWYAAGDTGLSPTSNTSTTYFNSPWNGDILLNYRKKRFASTLSMQITEGAGYGGPYDTYGFDPRTCGANASMTTRPNPAFDPSKPVSATNQPTVNVTPITSVSPTTDPNACDVLSSSTSFSTAAGQLFIPNPQTGSFAAPGQYRNPWMMVGNLALSYDLSPRVSANVTLANLFHTCWGGTKGPWTTAYAPGPNVCGYQANPLYISNFYNGTSPNDTAANGVTPKTWQQNSYEPRWFNDAGTIPSPFNVYFQLTVKV